MRGYTDRGERPYLRRRQWGERFLRDGEEAASSEREPYGRRDETRRRRNHTGAEEVARTYHDAGRRRTADGVMGSRRRRSVAWARTLAKWARLRTEAN
jgi:hypothetical protein